MVTIVSYTQFLFNCSKSTIEILEQGFPLGFVMFIVMLCPTSTFYIFLF